MKIRKDELVEVNPETFAKLPEQSHSMRYIMLKYAYRSLKTYDFNRSYAAREIGVSLRTLRNMVHEMRAAGWVVPASTFTVTDALRIRQEQIAARDANVDPNSMASRYRDVFKTKPDPEGTLPEVPSQ
jgi:hypothetical protein